MRDYLAPSVTPEPHISTMRFLERFLRFLQHIFRAGAEAQSELEPPIPGRDPEQTPCTRFLNSSKKYNRAQNRATYRAFEPTFDDVEHDVVLSMYRLDELDTDAAWDLGRRVLGPAGGRLHGRADLTSGEICSIPEGGGLAEKLRVRFDSDPPRHVTVAGWHNQKEIRKLRQIDLASVARLHLMDAAED